MQHRIFLEKFQITCLLGGGKRKNHLLNRMKHSMNRGECFWKLPWGDGKVLF